MTIVNCPFVKFINCLFNVGNRNRLSLIRRFQKPVIIWQFRTFEKKENS